jgi:hypothetical protein
MPHVIKEKEQCLNPFSSQVQLADPKAPQDAE